MSDLYRPSMIDSTRTISFDGVTLLTTSTINTLHFPDLTSSGIADSNGSRRTSLLFDGIGMCESMTESFCSTGGQDDGLSNINTNTLQPDTNNSKIERIDSKKRRSRKAQFDASIDGISLDKIETVNVIDEKDEPDDAWLYEVPKNGNKNGHTKDNIFSWVHKEFKTNDIHANKHRLLCKLDDMSHARTIRSVSCHNFLDNQRFDSVKRSSTDQQVNSEPVKNGRLSSPFHTTTSNGNTRPRSPINLSPLRPNTTAINTNNTALSVIERPRDVSRERERGSMDYTDLQVMAKVQLENLRQAERQGPLSKRFGGSNVSLASTSSGTSVCVSNHPGTKPPVAPKSTVIRNSVRPNSYQRSNTQTIVSSSSDAPFITESKPSVTLATRVSLLPPNSANNNRTRPPRARPIQSYRGSQTTFSNNPKVPIRPTSVQRNGKKLSNDFGSTYTTKEFSSNGNGLLNDVSNKPLTAPIRSQVGPQRRTILPQSSGEQIPPSTSSSSIGQTILPRSSSSLSQGRKSGIPTIGKPQKPSTATVTRSTSSNVIPPFQSSASMMVTKTAQTQRSISHLQISKPTTSSSWNDGCY